MEQLQVSAFANEEPNHYDQFYLRADIIFYETHMSTERSKENEPNEVSSRTPIIVINCE